MHHHLTPLIVICLLLLYCLIGYRHYLRIWIIAHLRSKPILAKRKRKNKRLPRCRKSLLEVMRVLFSLHGIIRSSKGQRLSKFAYWDFSKLAKAKYCSAWGVIGKWKCYPTVIPAKAGIQFLTTIFLDSSLRWNDIECYLLSIFIHAFRTNPNEYWLQGIFQNSQLISSTGLTIRSESYSTRILYQMPKPV